jgi:hypothetical protein
LDADGARDHEESDDDPDDVVTSAPLALSPMQFLPRLVHASPLALLAALPVFPARRHIDLLRPPRDRPRSYAGPAEADKRATPVMLLWVVKW